MITVALSRTNLITQAGLENTGLSFDLSVEETGKVAKGEFHGVGSGKEASVEDLDLLSGNGQTIYEPRRGGITLFSIFFVVAGSAKKSWYAKSGIFLMISSRGTYSSLGGK